MLFVTSHKNISSSFTNAATFLEFNQWPAEKVDEFVRELLVFSTTKRFDDYNDDEEVSIGLNFGSSDTASVMSAAKKLGVSSQQYYASRQAFLRSYNFEKKKPSVIEKTLMWFKNKARCLMRALDHFIL